MSPSLSVDDMEFLMKANGVPVNDPRNGLTVPRIEFRLSDGDGGKTPWELAYAAGIFLERLAILVADDQYELSPEYLRDYIDNLIQQILVIIDCNEITPGAGC